MAYERCRRGTINSILLRADFTSTHSILLHGYVAKQLANTAIKVDGIRCIQEQPP